jgi:hypothetical protein
MIVAQLGKNVTPLFFTKNTPWPLVSKGTKPTEGPPLVDEI